MKREGPRTDYLGNFIKRQNLYANNATKLWGSTFNLYIQDPEFHKGQDVLMDGDKAYKARTNPPLSARELFGEEVIISVGQPDTEAAKFWFITVKGFWKENPTSLQLETFGLKEKRDVMVGLTIDVFNRSVKDYDLPFSPLYPLPGDFLEFYPLQLHSEWYQNSGQENYYYYYPGRALYVITDVLPTPGRLISPPVGVTIAANYFREAKRLLVKNFERMKADFAEGPTSS